MGTGKSCVGLRLAKYLNKLFVDSDQEVQKAAGGATVSDIFSIWGEKAFRMAEYRVLSRYLTTYPPHVMSTGEGAFIHTPTRNLLLDKTITIWLKSDIDTLVTRVERKARPQFAEGDTRTILEQLAKERYPIYAQAEIHVESNDSYYQEAVNRILAQLKDHLYPSYNPTHP